MLQVVEERGLVTDRMILPRFRAVWRRWRRGAALRGPYLASQERDLALVHQHRLVVEGGRQDLSAAVAAALEKRTAVRRARVPPPFPRGLRIFSSEANSQSYSGREEGWNMQPQIQSAAAGPDVPSRRRSDRHLLKEAQNTQPHTRVTSSLISSKAKAGLHAEICWPTTSQLPAQPVPQEPNQFPSRPRIRDSGEIRQTSQGDKGLVHSKQFHTQKRGKSEPQILDLPLDTKISSNSRMQAHRQNRSKSDGSVLQSDSNVNSVSRRDVRSKQDDWVLAATGKEKPGSAAEQLEGPRGALVPGPPRRPALLTSDHKLPEQTARPVKTKRAALEKGLWLVPKGEAMPKQKLQQQPEGVKTGSFNATARPHPTAFNVKVGDLVPTLLTRIHVDKSSIESRKLSRAEHQNAAPRDRQVSEHQASSGAKAIRNHAKLSYPDGSAASSPSSTPGLHRRRPADRVEPNLTVTQAPLPGPSLAGPPRWAPPPPPQRSLWNGYSVSDLWGDEQRAAAIVQPHEAVQAWTVQQEMDLPLFF